MRLRSTVTAMVVATLGGAAGAALMVEPAPAATEKPIAAPNVSATDERFLDDTYSINQGEMMLGHLAELRATGQPAINFAVRMIGDHTKALEVSKHVAASVHVTLPTTVDSATRNLYDHLAKKSGRDFDTAYLSSMVSGHETAVSAFENEVKAGLDPMITSYAREELPMLREHLALAREAQQEEQTGVAAPQKP